MSLGSSGDRNSPDLPAAEIELSTRVPQLPESKITSVTFHKRISPNDTVTVRHSQQITSCGEDSSLKDDAGEGAHSPSAQSRNTKITVDVVVDLKGIRLCDHHK